MICNSRTALISLCALCIWMMIPASAGTLTNEELRANVQLCKNAAWNPRDSRCAGLPTWDTSSVTDMSGLFQNAASFNLDISQWNTSSVTDMSHMFAGATRFNVDISRWDTRSLTRVINTFRDASAFNIDLCGWFDSSVAGLLSNIFVGTPKLSLCDIDECVDIDTCDANSFCTNTDGSFVCTCYDQSGSNDDGTCFFTNQGLRDVVNSCRLHSWQTSSPLCRGMPFWNTSRVTDMSGLFSNQNTFNLDISRWDTGAVTDMSNMFLAAGAFNHPLGAWDTSKVTDMSYMFFGAWSFDQDLSGWATGQVTDMSYAFADASRFNSDLSLWDTSRVSTMSHMFASSAINCNLSAWDTSNASVMDNMFQSARSFNGDIASWDTRAVEDMRLMFWNAISFNGDISRWDVSNVELTTAMFNRATSFNVDLCAWADSSFAGGPDIFSGTRKLSLCDVDECFVLGMSSGPCDPTAACINTDGSFTCQCPLATETVDDGRTCAPGVDECADAAHSCHANATCMNTLGSFICECPPDWVVVDEGQTCIPWWETALSNSELIRHVDACEEAGWDERAEACTEFENWDTSSVTDMSYLFSTYGDFNGDVSRWNTSAVTDMSGIFQWAATFAGNISGWDTSSVTSMDRMFRGCQVFNADISRWDTSAVTDMTEMFDWTRAFTGNLSRWNTGKVVAMKDMFAYSSFNGDLSGWDTSRVTDMSGLFFSCFTFNGDVSRWNTGSVTDMDLMFATTRFNSDISRWNTSAVEGFNAMFHGAVAFNGDLSRWDVRSTTHLGHMFTFARSFNRSLDQWDVSRVAFMYEMFGGATAFNGDLSSWDVSGVQFWDAMFLGATSFNSDISRWDVSNIVSLAHVFRGATAFNADLSRWDTSRMLELDRAFWGASTFNSDISHWNTSSLRWAPSAFLDAASFNVDLCRWDLSSLEDQRDTFRGCPKLSFCDVDECLHLNGGCAENATCSNTDGSFVCTCPAGHETVDEGRSCVAGANECADGTHNCDAFASCSNTLGSFTCDCMPGTSGDGTMCADIDECADGSHTCGDAACTNHDGAFSCACAQGYQPMISSQCRSLGGRQAAGSNKCFFMPSGGPASWLDARDICLAHHATLASITSESENDAAYAIYVASSAAEFDDGKMWIGANDRAVEGEWRWADGSLFAFSSWAHQQPNNYNGQDCGLMWRDEGEWQDEGCELSRPFLCSVIVMEIAMCVEVDECESAPCDPNATCTNTDGSFTCACPEGFETVDGGVSCFVGEDECLGDPCHDLATCTNTLGSFTCSCPAGYGTHDEGRSCSPWLDPALPNCQEDRTSRQLDAVFNGRRGALWRGMVTGGLGKLMVVDKYETWICLKGHPCLADFGLAQSADWMCFVLDEAQLTWKAWGPNSALNLVDATPVRLLGTDATSAAHSSSSLLRAHEALKRTRTDAGVPFSARLAAAEMRAFGTEQVGIVKERIEQLEVKVLGEVGAGGLLERVTKIETASLDSNDSVDGRGLADVERSSGQTSQPAAESSSSGASFMQRL